MAYTHTKPKDTFQPGDLVRISTKLPPEMSHFPAARLAYIKYSYEQRFGHSGAKPEFALDIVGYGFSAWYPVYTLTLVKRHSRCPGCDNIVKGKKSAKTKKAPLGANQRNTW